MLRRRITCCQDGFRLTESHVGLMPLRRLQPNEQLIWRIVGVSWAQSATAWCPCRIRCRAHVSSPTPEYEPSQDLDGLDLARTATVDAPVEPLTGTPGRRWSA
jgi:hypothetical protein